MNDASTAGSSTNETEIKAMLQRYFYALDARDREVLETCFAEDVEVQYHTGTAGQFTQSSAQSIVDYLIDNMQNYKARTHVGANMHVWIKGETATSVTHAVATLLKGERLVIRGLRYTDEHMKIAGEWRITRRKHQPLWQYEATPMQPDIPAPALKLAAEQARK